LLALVTISGVLCLVPAMAMRGNLWAIAAAVALVGAMLLLVIQGLSFVVTRAIGSALGGRAPGAAEGPGR
jgi:hypothetical protein